MNTVGKQGKLGEHVRCVVSVSMLTEGWDANTVTHILGVRAFGTQLLCEQVVGRGLRRRSLRRQRRRPLRRPSTPRSTACRSPSSPATGRTEKPPPGRPAIEVRALDERGDAARSRFPKLDGYRVELPDEQLHSTDFNAESRSHVDQRRARHLDADRRASSARSTSIDLDDVRDARAQRGRLRARQADLLRRNFAAHDGGDASRGCSRSSSTIARRWLDECVTFDADTSVGLLLLAAARRRGRRDGLRRDRPRHGAATDRLLLPMLPPLRPDGSTDDVDFVTRKVVIDPPTEVPRQPRRARRRRGQHLGGEHRRRPRAHPRRRAPTSRTTTSASPSPTSTRAGATTTCPTSSSASTTEPDDVDAHADRRGLRRPKSRRPDRRRRPTPPATSGARRQQPRRASAAGASSRSPTCSSAEAVLDAAIERPVRRRADHRRACRA